MQAAAEMDSETTDLQIPVTLAFTKAISRLPMERGLPKGTSMASPIHITTGLNIGASSPISAQRQTPPQERLDDDDSQALIETADPDQIAGLDEADGTTRAGGSLPGTALQASGEHVIAPPGSSVDQNSVRESDGVRQT